MRIRARQRTLTCRQSAGTRDGTRRVRLPKCTAGSRCVQSRPPRYPRAVRRGVVGDAATVGQARFPLRRRSRRSTGVRRKTQSAMDGVMTALSDGHRAPIDTPSVEEFGAAAETFLDRVAPRRNIEQDRPFVWAEGSDTVELFKTTSPEEIAAARNWPRQPVR